MRGPRQTDMQRCAAFVKRLACVALQAAPGVAVASLVAIRFLLTRHPRCRALLDPEPGGAPVGAGLVAVCPALPLGSRFLPWSYPLSSDADVIPIWHCTQYCMALYAVLYTVRCVVLYLVRYVVMCALFYSEPGGAPVGAGLVAVRPALPLCPSHALGSLLFFLMLVACCINCSLP